MACRVEATYNPRAANRVDTHVRADPVRRISSAWLEAVFLEDALPRQGLRVVALGRGAGEVVRLAGHAGLQEKALGKKDCRPGSHRLEV